MNRLTISLAVAALCVGGAFAQTEHKQHTRTANRTQTTGTNTAAAEELKKIENDWMDAAKSKDESKLSNILADNWVEQTWDGKVVDKAKALDHMKKEGNNLESIEMGPMDVRMLGNNMAVVMGSNTEKSTMDGKDTSGKYYWTDVFVKENGKWKAVASQSSKAPGDGMQERSRSGQDQSKPDQPDQNDNQPPR